MDQMLRLGGELIEAASLCQRLAEVFALEKIVKVTNGGMHSNRGNAQIGDGDNTKLSADNGVCAANDDPYHHGDVDDITLRDDVLCNLYPLGSLPVPQLN